MSAEEFAALQTRVERLERLHVQGAEIVRRALFQIIRWLEREFDLPPIPTK